MSVKGLADHTMFLLGAAVVFVVLNRGADLAAGRAVAGALAVYLVLFGIVAIYRYRQRGLQPNDNDKYYLFDSLELDDAAERARRLAERDAVERENSKKEAAAATPTSEVAKATPSSENGSAPTDIHR
ncbi:hypothetical protein [Austwickia chelonae]|uniref:hypothetical protein n=1 Tax=Austwickia chelonae TaxID=100225 RepID=UPI0013C351B5|nr:hypothetical protein [Austwickia chelonae]